MKYEFSGKLKIASIAATVIGLVLILVSFFIYGDNITRVWANLLVTSFFFTGIAVAGIFFVAVNLVGEGGWYTVIKRVPESLSHFVPFGMFFLLIVVVAGMLGLHDVYKWMNPEIVANDEIIQGKSGYLNNIFFLVRFAFYAAVWIGFSFMLRKLSLQDDLLGTYEHYIKSRNRAATFLVLFAVTSSTSAWDFIMSVDAHWFSTLFGWYTFAGYWVSAVAIMLVLVLHLKKNGYLPSVNMSHIHDLGKFLFAFSIFWTYLYFSQFLLIWYADMPEEIVYYIERYDTSYRPWVLVMVVLNLVLPLLVLMTRDAKRNANTLTVIAVLVVIGHYMDLFQMVMPGAVGDKWGWDFPEIGALLFFAGLFTFVVLNALTKTAVQPAKGTYLEESKHHAI